jgi:REase_AHJR-like
MPPTPSNSPSNVMELDSISNIANRYRSEGYEVIVHPEGDDIPPFAHGLRPDMIARKPGESVIVEVKSHRFDLENSPEVARLAEITNAQPGWRFDLVIAEPESPAEKAAQEASEPSDTQLAKILDTADALADGGHSPYACVIAWAGLEAAMRRVRKEVELYGRTAPNELMRTLYSNGLLSREQFEKMRAAFKVRTQLVHGLVPENIEPESAHFLTATARYLLGGDEGPRGRVAG